MATQSFDFQKEVIQQSYTKPVLVQFSTQGCGPCFWMEKTLIDLVRKHKEKVNFVSTLSDAKSTKKYNITTNPSTLLFIRGNEVARLKGALPLMVVEQWLFDHLNK